MSLMMPDMRIFWQSMKLEISSINRAKIILQSKYDFKVTTTLSQEIVRYEKQLGIKYTDQKIKWDFWNAMLYAQV